MTPSFAWPLLLVVTAGAHAAAPPNASVLAAEYCATCHNAKARTAGFDVMSAGTTAATWRRASERLTEASMPPRGLPRPTAKETLTLSAWLASRAAAASISAKVDPGRVTAHRLNRYEYNRTVEDLLAIRYRPADAFPADDAGYGFDNIGDVLSLPPVLLEKYLSAAERIAQLAAGAGVTPHVASDRVRNPAGTSPSQLNLRRMVAEEADYDVSLRLQAKPSAFPPGASLTLAVDASEAHSFPMTSTGEPPRVFTQRVHLTAGEHDFRAVATLPLEAPANALAISSFELRGPYAPTVPGLTESQRRVYICGHLPGAHKPACARTIVSNLARRAWRRPVTAAELDRLLGFVELARGQGDTFENAIGLSLTAILVSPNFLFRIERDPASTAIHPLNDFELASRLSYFLWSSIPDDALFAAAQRGALRRPAELARETRRMLADPKHARLVENFAGQWLLLRNLDSLRPDARRFPEFDDDLRAAMKSETTLLFDNIIREDRPVTDFLNARYTFLNQRLARHYSIAGVEGANFRRVDLAGGERRGILTQASVLAVTSYPTRTSPVLRGKWLLDNILGTPVPPPPADVPSLDESKAAAAASLRVQLEEHRANAVCASCHSRMDPLGFAFEKYDAIGRYRETEGSTAIDASGTLPSGEHFDGAQGLLGILAARSDAFTRALAGKLLVYALGRGLESNDDAALDQICARVKRNQYRFSALVEAIVESPPFRLRRPEGARP